MFFASTLTGSDALGDGKEFTRLRFTLILTTCGEPNPFFRHDSVMAHRDPEEVILGRGDNPAMKEMDG